MTIRSGPNHDPLLDELLAQPNVLVTGHQAFLTQQALGNIADTTLQNINEWELGQPISHELHPA
ncbi:MAG: hypothetical protein WKG07_00015 [Hymenobacter sp.]